MPDTERSSKFSWAMIIFTGDRDYATTCIKSLWIDCTLYSKWLYSSLMVSISVENKHSSAKLWGSLSVRQYSCEILLKNLSNWRFWPIPAMVTIDTMYARMCHCRNGRKLTWFTIVDMGYNRQFERVFYNSSQCIAGHWNINFCKV